MQKNQIEITNLSDIRIKNETNKEITTKSQSKPTDNINSEKTLKNNCLGRKIRKLWIIESILIGIIIIVVISLIMIVAKNMSSNFSKKNMQILSSVKPEIESTNEKEEKSATVQGFFKRKLLSCPAGYYLSGKNCRQCSAGTYSTRGKNICLKCPAGKYSKAGASSCIQCDAGYYSKEGSSICFMCSSGTYSSKGSSICKKCPAGYYSNSGSSTCKKCLAGTYSYAGASKCEKCPAGKYSKEGATNCNYCSEGTYSLSGSSKCTPCPKGTYSLKGYSTCKYCDPGLYSNQGSSTCSKCPVGTYSSKGSGSCTKCPPGTYSNILGTSKCNLCNAGYYSKIGSSTCIKCPVGKTSTAGSSTCTDLCKSGYYYYWGKCYICPGGTHSVSDFSKCIDCQRGTSSSSGASYCKNCPAGTYASSSKSTICLECPAGTYSSIGAYECKKCPIGTTSKKGSSICVTEAMKEAKEILSFTVSSFLHDLEAFATKYNFDTAKIGAKILNLRADKKGIYHAEFDCWQSIFGYNKFYDLLFDLGTSMDLNKEGMFTYNGKNYILWAWKGDYINLGAGAELGIYYDGLSKNSHWKVDKSLAMPMTLTLKHRTKGTIVNNWDNWGNDAWWITAFNPNPNYKNLKAKDLTATFSVKFKNVNMFNEFSKTKRNGWEYDTKNKIAKLVF